MTLRHILVPLTELIKNQEKYRRLANVSINKDFQSEYYRNLDEALAKITSWKTKVSLEIALVKDALAKANIDFS